MKIRTEITIMVNNGLNDRMRQARIEREPDVMDRYDKIGGYDDYSDDEEYQYLVSRIKEVTLYDQLRHRGW